MATDELHDDGIARRKVETVFTQTWLNPKAEVTRQILTRHLFFWSRHII